MKTRWTVLTVIGLALLAGALRFHRLGEWSFAGDELSTFNEVDSLLETRSFDPSTQIYRLPRLIPLSHATLGVGYELFGRDEFGSRTLPALLGTLGVVVVFLGLDRLMGRPAALTTALLFCFWPEHLFHSQENRFYAPASLAASLCLLLGAWSVKRRSVFLAVLTGVAAFVAVLTHSLLAVLFPGLLLATFFAARAERGPVPWGRLAAVAVCCATTVALAAVYLARLGAGWNAEADWGYTVAHALQAAVNRAGYPVALLALLGALDALRRRDPVGVFWVTFAGVWAATAAALPLVLQYSPAYTFPLALGVFALAGHAVARLYDGLRGRDPAVAGAWVGVACLLILPGVVSHYCDGSRCDYRGAARYVADHWRPGDRVAVSSDKNLGYYLPAHIRPRSVRMTPEALAQVAKESDEGRIWVVLATNRGGKPEALARYLAPRCSLQTVVRRPRLDYFDYNLEVYLQDRPEGQASAKPGDRPEGRREQGFGAGARLPMPLLHPVFPLDAGFPVVRGAGDRSQIFSFYAGLFGN